MRRLFAFILFAYFFLYIPPSFANSSTRGLTLNLGRNENVYLYKDYHALVLGVSEYEKWPKLPYAAKDAQEVAEKLRTLGFQVTLLLNVSSNDFRAALNELIYQTGIEEDRAILMYYAGHGETETLADNTKLGYIIPKDCPLLKKDPMGFASHAISMRDIESVSLRIKSKHVLMIFDSCFSGSLFTLVRSPPQDISEKSSFPVRQFITAGMENEVVPDRSVFKRCFLIGLEGDADLTGDGYVTGTELGMYLSDKVVNYSHRKQHPQYGKINNPDLDRGDFIIASPKMREDKEKFVEKPNGFIDEGRIDEGGKKIKPEQQNGIIKPGGDIPVKQDQEKRLTYIPEEVKKPKEHTLSGSESGLKLAIFPIGLEGKPISRVDLKGWAIAGIDKSIERSRLFSQVFSYYDTKNKRSYKKIDNYPDEKEIWYRKNIFSVHEPNIDLAIREGKRLSADAVLLSYITHTAGIPEATFHFYLINVNSGRKYKRTKTIRGPAVKRIIGIMNNIFSDYKNDLKTDIQK